MNIRLLRKIAKVIQEKPRSLDMSLLHSAKGIYVPQGCATAHCICGWAGVLLNMPDLDAGNSDLVFGIGPTEQRRLFWVRGWPNQFSEAYLKSSNSVARSKVAAARIEHFIKTKGAE